MLYDLAIIGGGPAGVAAGVYASRKRLKTIFITESFGGQSIDSQDIENWIGTPHISGFDLAEALKKHLQTYAGEVVEIAEGARANLIEKVGANFSITASNGKKFEAKAVLICSGSHRRKLDIPGASALEHKGITYCASCDGPLYAEKDTLVIGGGNAALETAAQLLAYAKSVTILQRSDDFRADPVTLEKVLQNPKTKTISGATFVEVKGEPFKPILVYKNKAGETIELPTDGIFVEIGLLPTTELVKNLVKLNQYNQILVDPKNQRALGIEGLWAAGDCTDGLYHQNNIAAGDAVKALEDIYLWLAKK